MMNMKTGTLVGSLLYLRTKIMIRFCLIDAIRSFNSDW